MSLNPNPNKEIDKLKNVSYAYETYGLTLQEQKEVLQKLRQEGKTLQTAINEVKGEHPRTVRAGKDKINKILNQLKTKNSKKVDIIKENEKQISIITNLKQKLEKRENVILNKINNINDPLLKNDLSGYIEEIRDILIEFNRMIDYLLKINSLLKSKNLIGGVSYHQTLNSINDIEMMPHLASYYEGAGVMDKLKEGYQWIKENPLKASAYAFGALGLANILTNPPELDFM